MIPESPMTRRGNILPRLLPWLILAIGFAITLQLWHTSRADQRRVVEGEFNFRVQELIGNIERRLFAYEQVLRGAAGFMAASERVERAEFEEYVRAMGLQSSYPGIQGVGYSRMIQPAARLAHIERIRAEGFPEFTLRPEGEREIYTSIDFLEPFTWRNQRAFGYDMYSEPVRRLAMARARDEDSSAVSGKVQLVQETERDVQAGFLMYVPVYRNGAPHATLAERRANLVGWTYSPFRMNDLMRGILGQHYGEITETLDLKIHDGDQVSEQGLMYDSLAAVGIPREGALFRVSKVLDVSGRPWTISVSSLPAFETRMLAHQAQLLLLTGTLGSLLLAMVVWLLASGGSRAYALATQMTDELRASESRMRELFENMSSGVAIYRASPDGHSFVFTAFNRAAEKIERLPRKEVIGKEVREVFPGVEEFGLLEVFRRVHETGVAEPFPISHYRDGRITGWRENYVYRLPDGAIVAIYDDVTARKQAEEALHEYVLQVEDLYNNAPCGYHSLGPDGLVVRMNDTELTWLGYTRDELVGKLRFQDLISPRSRLLFDEIYPRFKQRGWIKDVEYELVRKDGSTLPVLVSATSLRDRDGQYVMSRSTVYDVTAQRKAEQTQERLNRALRLLSDCNMAVVHAIDEQTLLSEVCRLVVDTGGYRMAWVGFADEGEDRRVIPVASAGVDEGYLDQANISWADEARGRGPIGTAIRTGEVEIEQDFTVSDRLTPWRDAAVARGYLSIIALPLVSGGSVFGALAIYAPQANVFSPEEVKLLAELANDLAYGIETLRSRIRRETAEQQLQFLAHHDLLTRLPNRLLLRERFAAAAAQADRELSGLAILFLDLDNFKQVNDSLGHHYGDQLLLRVVERLRSCTRDRDVICRHGGDEFVVLVDGASDAVVIERMSHQIIDVFTEPFEIEGYFINASFSIGISRYPQDGREFDLLLRQADAALYHAKEAGRNTYRFFNHKMGADAVDELQMHGQLRKAIKNGEFLLHYQPQIDIASGCVVGAEALVRWQHPETGLVAPGRFIPVAERSGLIIQIGEWVLNEACRQLRAWQDAGLPPLVVAVNLSALQFRSGNIVEVVADALERSGVPAEQLELELTESILLHDLESTLTALQSWKAMGVKLSIDDFGTGYSSLSYLKRLAVDKLKIDQSFVRDLTDDPEDAAIVRAIIQLGHTLQLAVIAEGVETGAQLSFLHEYGCDEAQGFHFSRPLPAEAFASLVQEWSRRGRPIWPAVVVDSSS